MKGGEGTRKLIACWAVCIFVVISMFPSSVHAAGDWEGLIDSNYLNTTGRGQWHDNDPTTGAPAIESRYEFNAIQTGLKVDSLKIKTDGALIIRFAKSDYSVISSLDVPASPNIQTFSVSVTGMQKLLIYKKDTSAVFNIYEIEVFSNSPPPDLTPPAMPTGFTGKVVGQDAVFNWLPNTESDLSKYYLYQDGAKKLETAERSATIQNLSPGTYKFQLSAVDHSGNESTKSEIVTLEIKPPPPPDTTPPAVPLGLVGTGADKQAILKWNANTESDLAGYVIYQDGKEIHRTSSNSASVTGLTNGKSYSFAVAAYDLTGNVSAKSNSVTVVPSDKIDVNLIPNMDSIIVQIISGTSPFDIDWGNGNDTFNSSQYTITGLTANTDYTVTITDAQGRVWTATINTGDKKGYIPPTFPNPQELFQKMLNVFGTAGTIAVAIIGGAIALGIICILAMWAWRLLKRWLAKSR